MAESYTGRVCNGIVVFEVTPPLAEGTSVRVEPIATESRLDDPVAGTRRLLLDWARRAEQIAPPLPGDLAAEHDLYAHGKLRIASTLEVGVAVSAIRDHPRQGSRSLGCPPDDSRWSSRD